MDEFGFAATLNGGLVPGGDEARARSAVEACPENAITVRG
jgi:ferredoxin